MRLFWNRILCGVIYPLLVIGVAHSASAQNRKTVEKSDQTTLSEKVGREGKPAKRNESALRKGATSIPSQPAEEISGTVTEQDMVTPIPWATVEAWDDYPCGVIIGTDVTDGDGSYSISGLPVGNYYDVRVYKEGYCPQQAFNIPVLSADVNFSLAQIPAITPTATWTDFYGLSTNFFGCPVHPGDVITAFDPDGVLCGSYYVMNDGWYGLMAVYGDDTSTPEDEGAKVGDLISFRINCIPANVVSGDPTWTGAQVQVELEVPPPPDLIVDEFTADPMKQWAGQPIEITLRIKNQGVGDVISPFQSGVYDSPPPGTPSIGNILDYTLPRLPSGQSYEWTPSMQSPDPVEVAWYPFVDTKFEIYEADENNNVPAASDSNPLRPEWCSAPVFTNYQWPVCAAPCPGPVNNPQDINSAFMEFRSWDSSPGDRKFHRAIDINADMNDPVFAISSGYAFVPSTEEVQIVNNGNTEYAWF